MTPQPFPKDFYVERLLGEGSFGQVWLAEDMHLPRQVALKTIRTPRGFSATAESLEALKREAACLVGVQHPNVVGVYAWRQSGDDPYLILEYVEGGSLDTLVRTGPLPWDRATRYVADVAEGLLATHAKGIIHRDIKPANILWDRELDEAKLSDFGVSGRLGVVGAVGTLVYMAPEALGGQASEASDVYSLAATLFCLMAGEVPFRGMDREAQATLIDGGLPNVERRFSGVPQALEQVIREGLIADPKGRPSLSVFLNRLRGALNQGLADNLSVVGNDGLRLVVSRERANGLWEPVAATHLVAERLHRDMRKVPRLPQSVTVRTGELVRIEVAAERDGFVSVFNIGPTGNLNLLYPGTEAVPDPAIRADKPLHISDIEFAAPAGRERVFAIWSAEPLNLSRRNLLQVAVITPYRVSRDMRRVKEVVDAVAKDRQVTVLEVMHVA